MVEQSSENAALDMKKVIMHTYLMVRDYSNSRVPRHFCKMLNSREFYPCEMGDI